MPDTIKNRVGVVAFMLRLLAGQRAAAFVPARARAAAWALAVIMGMVTGMSSYAQTLTVTNVHVVNVTHSSFSLVWFAGEAATPAIQVYQDASGTQSLEGTLGIEVFPVHTGDPELSSEYERRRDIRDLQRKTRGSGWMHIRVSGCDPETVYHYRLLVRGDGGGEVSWPSSNELASVTTSRGNSFVPDSRQLILKLPLSSAEGRIVTLSTTNAAHGLAAVVGDGAGTNEVYFSLSDLFELTGGGNYIPVGDEQFEVELLEPGTGGITARYTVNFGTRFSVGTARAEFFGRDFMALEIGRAVVRAGATGSVPIRLDTTTDVSELRFAFSVPAGRFSDFRLENLAPNVVDSAIEVSEEEVSVRLSAAAGQTLELSESPGSLAFTAAADLSSAFIPLRLSQVTGTKVDGSDVAEKFVASGRVTVIGREPLLELTLGAGNERALIVYGNSGSMYQIQRSARVSSDNSWQDWQVLTVAELSHEVILSDSDAALFFRAFELGGDTPYIRVAGVSQDGLELTLYGKANSQYRLETASNIAGGAIWVEVHAIATTTNKAAQIIVPLTSGQGFFRAEEVVGNE